MKQVEFGLPVGTILTGGEHQYKIEEALGQGGFGITYRVSTRIVSGRIAIDAQFAIKEHFVKGRCHRAADNKTVEYSIEAAKDIQESRADFKTEGERLARICVGNPNIVTVNEVFEENNTVYFVMEYLDGGDVRSLVKSRGHGLSEAETISIITPIAMAVEYIHSHLLLHLDIKPDNIVMRKGLDGQPDIPVLIDFGISLHFNKKGELTTTHTLFGKTEGYSPQEQYSDVRTFRPEMDVYALAATAYYMLTGSDPDGAFSIKPGMIAEKLPKDLSDRTREAIIKAMAEKYYERTPTPRAFANNFKERYSLPINHVIHGNVANYRIVGIKDETDSYLHYVVTVDTGYSLAGDDHHTSVVSYDLFECFRRNASQRMKDESVMGINNDEVSAFLAFAKKEIGVDQVGLHERMGDLVNFDCFATNGTVYFLRRQGWRTAGAMSESFKSVGGFFSKNLKYILIAIAAILIVFLLVKFAPSIGNLFKSDGSTEVVADSIGSIEDEEGIIGSGSGRGDISTSAVEEAERKRELKAKAEADSIARADSIAKAEEAARKAEADRIAKEKADRERAEKERKQREVQNTFNSYVAQGDNFARQANNASSMSDQTSLRTKAATAYGKAIEYGKANGINTSAVQRKADKLWNY